MDFVIQLLPSQASESVATTPKLSRKAARKQARREGRGGVRNSGTGAVFFGGDVFQRCFLKKTINFLNPLVKACVILFLDNSMCKPCFVFENSIALRVLSKKWLLLKKIMGAERQHSHFSKNAKESPKKCFLYVLYFVGNYESCWGKVWLEPPKVWTVSTKVSPKSFASES